MKRTVILLAALAALAACNTMQGMGQDISAGGQAISGTASKTKEKM